MVLTQRMFETCETAQVHSDIPAAEPRDRRMRGEATTITLEACAKDRLAEGGQAATCIRLHLPRGVPMKTDIELRRDIEQELEWEPSVDQRRIGVSVVDGVVTLTGEGARREVECGARCDGQHRPRSLRSCLPGTSIIDQWRSAARRSAPWSRSRPRASGRHRRSDKGRLGTHVGKHGDAGAAS